MKFLELCAIFGLALALTVLQSACMLSGKSKTASAAVTPPPPKPEPAPKPAPPPEPLSVPQTQVQFPPEQPLNLDALTPAKPEEPAPAPTAPRSARRATTAPKPETPPAAAAPAAAPVVAPKPEEAEPVQEVLTPEDRKRLEESAQNKKGEIKQLLAQIKRHRLSGEESRDVKRIQSLVAQSDEVERRGDMRQADALAERALILAREMTSVK